MSLKANILANYLSQAYTTLIGLAVLPWYIRYMGVEAYGLVGFFTLLQSWFSLLDMGLMPMLARETARFQGGQLEAYAYRQLVRTLEILFLLLALGGGLSLWLSAGWLARHWLQVTTLDLPQVEVALQLIAINIALRWLGGIYRSIISGAEQLVWLGGLNALITSLRTLGVLPVLIWIDASIVTFFQFQLAIALLEIVMLWYRVLKLLPRLTTGQTLHWSLQPLKAVYRFSLSIAFASLVWILMTQIDKMLLSHLLSLTDYGYFSLAVLIASSVTLLSAPISSALVPRLAKLEAAGDTALLLSYYRRTTQWVTLVASTAAFTLAWCATPLLQLWTGNPQLTAQAAPILIPYALGNGLLALCAFPYYLQYAKGNLRLHLLGNALFLVFLVPASISATQAYGAIGAGYAWLLGNLLLFVLWVPWVHHCFYPGLNRLWYGRDVLPIISAVILASYGAYAVFPASEQLGWLLFKVCVVGLAALLAGGLAASELRARLFNKVKPDAPPDLRLHRHL